MLNQLKLCWATSISLICLPCLCIGVSHTKNRSAFEVKPSTSAKMCHVRKTVLCTKAFRGAPSKPGFSTQHLREKTQNLGKRG